MVCLEVGPGASDRWQALIDDTESGLDRRRKIARALLVPEILGEVRLRRCRYRGEPAEVRVTLVRA
jgi:hypothetical protein